MEMYMEGQHASILNGPMLFGYVLNALLFGILSVQTYIYFLAFPSDNRIFKSAVYGVYLIEILQTAFALRDLYFLACTGPNSGNKLYTTPGDFHQYKSTWFNIYSSTTLVAFVVQWLYARRIYLISRNILIVGTILVLSSVQLAIGFWGSVTVFRMSSMARFQAKEEAAVNAGYAACTIVWGCINTACGLVIALYMASYNPIGGAQNGLTKTIRFSVETGLLTTSVTIIYAVASIVPDPPLYMLTGLILGKLYSSSMMVMLNGRLTIKGGRNAGNPTMFDAPQGYSKKRTQTRRAQVSSIITMSSAKTDLEASSFEVSSRFRKSLASEITDTDIGAWDKDETWMRPPPSVERIDLTTP